MLKVNSVRLLSTSALMIFDFASRRSLKIMLKVCELANTMSDTVICSGPLPAYRGDEIHSRLLSLNGWMYMWCPQNNIGFIDNWMSFWGRPYLLKRDGLHPSWVGAALFSRNMAHSLTFTFSHFADAFIQSDIQLVLKFILDYLGPRSESRQTG